MRFGVLALTLDQVESIARAGYNCAEFKASTIMALDNAGFETSKRLFAGTGLKFDVFDEPLPPDVEICIKGFNKFIWREYLKKVCFRVSELGGKYLIFSNGKTRSIPLEGDLESAREKVMLFLITLCEIAGEYGITVMLEPLEESFSNMYNTLDECAALIKLLGIPNLTSMCSLRYFAAEDNSPKDIIKHKDIISYVHIDCPLAKYPQLLCPKENDGYDYRPFFDVLDKIQYGGILSISAKTYQDYENEIIQSIKLLKSFTACK